MARDDLIWLSMLLLICSCAANACSRPSAPSPALTCAATKRCSSRCRLRRRSAVICPASIAPSVDSSVAWPRAPAPGVTWSPRDRAIFFGGTVDMRVNRVYSIWIAAPQPQRRMHPKEQPTSSNISSNCAKEPIVRAALSSPTISLKRPSLCAVVPGQAMHRSWCVQPASTQGERGYRSIPTTTMFASRTSDCGNGPQPGEVMFT